MRIDRTRTPKHKARTISRRLARVEKSAAAFALLAFSEPVIGTADPDSRAAEKVYRACLEIALKLRAAIGDAGIEALRTACEDY